MKTVAAIVFIYLLCGAAQFAHNYAKAKTIVDADRLRSLVGPTAILLAVVLWLPYMIVMQFNNPIRDLGMRQAQEMLRGPSIQPMMPELPKECGHPNCKSFEADGALVLWCEHCGSLSIPVTLADQKSVIDRWVKPKDSIFFPLPLIRREGTS